MNRLINYLKIHTWARERKTRDIALLNLLAENDDYRMFMSDVKTDTLVNFVRDYTSLSRYWRKALQDDPNLRGKDWDDKETLEQQTELKLGYQPMHKEINKKVLSITNNN